MPEVAVGKGFTTKANHERKRPEQTTEKPQVKTQPTIESEAAANAVTTFREVRQPIERDDEETRQLLRLSQLEGRDPLQDAVAGRLALDRLDATADGDADPNRARWADELRRDLRERFNEIAPTKFKVSN